MSNPINSEFIIEKIDHCKTERNKLMIARNIAVILLSSAVFLADIGGHLNKTPLSMLAIILAYTYGGLAISCITLQISYRITKYTKYMNILEKYESKILSEEEKRSLKIELISMSETRIFLIFIINSLLYTLPISIFLGLLYYVIKYLN